MSITRRVLVTGSRDWTNVDLLERTLVAEIDSDDTLVHGGCPTGADQLAHAWAVRNNIDIEVHPAAWSLHGKAAGPIRNQEMVDTDPDLCLAFLLPTSRGTRDCIDRAQVAGIPVLTVESKTSETFDIEAQKSALMAAMRKHGIAAWDRPPPGYHYELIDGKYQAVPDETV